MSQTYKVAKLPYPGIDFFHVMYENLAPDKIKFFSLKKADRYVVSMCGLLFNSTLMPMYLGRTLDNDILRTKPVDLFYWEVLLWGMNNNCVTFDWLGAGKPDQEYGVRKFKLQYGGELVELGRYEKVYKPFSMKMGELGIKLRQKLK